MSIYLECVKENKKLRIKIISPGYNNNANCQFPKNIRVEGRKYEVPTSAVKVASIKSGTFFYRISKSSIKIVEQDHIDGVPHKIYDIPECCICISAPCDIVIVECGHLCLCQDCSENYKDTFCPMCMGEIKMRITKDQLS